MQWNTVAGELIDSKSSGNKVDMDFNDSSSRSCERKAEKAVWCCRSNELLQTLSFFNQPVLSEKADFCTRNDLHAILQTVGLGFSSFIGNMFV